MTEIHESLFDSLLGELEGGMNPLSGVMPQYADDPVGFGEKVLSHKYPDQIKEVMESVRDNKITIVQSCNAPGKSYSAVDLCLWWYKRAYNSQVYVTAAPPEDNLKNIIWGKISAATYRSPEIFADDKVRELLIERPPGKYEPQDDMDRIAGLRIPTQGNRHERVAKFSGKHAHNLLFIVDEGDGVPDEVYEGIETCMSGGNARLLILFNPKAKRGFVYRTIRDGLAKVIRLNAFDQPNVVDGRDTYPGAVNREITAERVNKFCRYSEGDYETSSEYFKLPDFMVGYEATKADGSKYPPLKAGYYYVQDPVFFYLVLGIYPPRDENQLISQEWINAARERWDAYVAMNGKKRPDETIGVAGLDVAELGKDKSTLCFRYGYFLERFKSWGGVDVLVTGDKATDFCQGAGVAFCSIDGNGFGAGVAPHMRRLGFKAYGYKTQERPTESCDMGDFRKLRDQLFWAVREWLKNDPFSMIPPEKELIEEMLVTTYTVESGKIVVMSKKAMKELLKRSPDKFDSLALTFAKKPQLDGGMDNAKHEALKRKHCSPGVGSMRQTLYDIAQDNFISMN